MSNNVENLSDYFPSNYADLLDRKPIKKLDEYPDIIQTQRGTKVLDTYTNLHFLLKKFHVVVMYNMMTRRREIIIPGIAISAEDIENSAYNAIYDIAVKNGMPTKQLDSHLDVLALQRSYHPVVEAIKGKPWDGIPRLDQFISTLKTTTPELSNKIVKTFMVCSIAAAHSITGFINNGVLVIQGDQNLRKTTWVRSLDFLNCNATATVFLDPTNKDSIAQIDAHWIVELGELETIFTKSEIGRLKSYITMESDYVRLPYARRATRIPRRTTYIATVNEENFLVDDTGNRRWWTITVTSIDLDHGLDIQQVWAEVYDLWQKGALTYLNTELQIAVNENNRNYEKIDPLRDKLLSFYNWSEPVECRRERTGTEILQELGYSKPTNGENKRMNKILTEQNRAAARMSNSKRLHKIPSYPDGSAAK